jgi:nucleoside 2-deoxyribosyltransferase
MKIYFSGSIRGGREHAEWYDFIVKSLSNYGKVNSEFVADKDLTSYGNINLSDEQIYQRDIDLIKESEIVIADVTVPSLGVGYELAYAEKLNKKIFCLYHHVEGKRISAMIAGDSNFIVLPYSNIEDITKILKNIFNK